MMKKINLALLFGGKSFEHEISLLSAQSILSVIDREKYDVTLIGIDKEGSWHFYEEGEQFIHPDSPEDIALGKRGRAVDPFLLKQDHEVDVVFPILHGPNGEDGTVQGLLKLIGLPYIGADTLGSAVGMDKDVMKRLLSHANVPVAKFITIYQHEKHLWPVERIVEQIPLPLFVKPANSGSSVGISKVKRGDALVAALDAAFRYDRKILVEEAIVGSEIQCSVMGNEEPIVSVPCQIVPRGEFHSYASKYLDPHGADFFIPARISTEESVRAQKLSLEAYKVLCCEGLARVDMFLAKTGEILVSEINTIPGLTKTSPYTKMWRASGMDFHIVIDKLIGFALARHHREAGQFTFINPHEKWIEQHV